MTNFIVIRNGYTRPHIGIPKNGMVCTFTSGVLRVSHIAMCNRVVISEHGRFVGIPNIFSVLYKLKIMRDL